MNKYILNDIINSDESRYISPSGVTVAAVDSKSTDSDIVPVRIRPWAPFKNVRFDTSCQAFFHTFKRVQVSHGFEISNNVSSNSDSFIVNLW